MFPLTFFMPDFTFVIPRPFFFIALAMALGQNILPFSSEDISTTYLLNLPTEFLIFPN